MNEIILIFVCCFPCFLLANINPLKSMNMYMDILSKIKSKVIYNRILNFFKTLNCKHISY